MKKRFFIIYETTKVQKMKGLKKLNYLFKVETLNHITIYNVMFSSVSNYPHLQPLFYFDRVFFSCVCVCVSERELTSYIVIISDHGRTMLCARVPLRSCMVWRAMAVAAANPFSPRCCSQTCFVVCRQDPLPRTCVCRCKEKTTFTQSTSSSIVMFLFLESSVSLLVLKVFFSDSRKFLIWRWVQMHQMLGSFVFFQLVSCLLFRKDNVS